MVVQQISILAQPLARVGVLGACVFDQAPEMARMIEPPQMHQLVNQHVVAHAVGHQYESPVEADVTRRGTGAPTRALIPYADARHTQAMVRGKPPQLIRQLEGRSAPQCSDRFRCVCEPARSGRVQLCLLTLNPGTLLLGEQLRVAARSPSRNGDTDASVGADTDDVTSSRRMADEFHETMHIVPRHES